MNPVADQYFSALHYGQQIANYWFYGDYVQKILERAGTYPFSDLLAQQPPLLSVEGFDKNCPVGFYACHFRQFHEYYCRVFHIAASLGIAQIPWELERLSAAIVELDRLSHA